MWPNYPTAHQVAAITHTAAERWVLLGATARRWDTTETWTPEPHQVPPPGDWLGWLLLAGRGSGKTDALAAWIDNHVRNDPPCMPGAQPHRIAIIAPTQGDAVDACVTGPSGLRAHNPGVILRAASAEGTIVRWPNGSRARLFGAREPEDVERLRAGGNNCRVWLEEFAAMRYMQDVFDQSIFGLRIGPDPRWGASTTPKPRALIKTLILRAERNDGVVITRATTADNPHLPAHIRAALFDRYGSSTLGQQELYGLIVEQDEAALWHREWLARYRIDLVDLPDLSRISVGVDPSGGAGEQGIVVVGKQMWSETVDGKMLPRHAGYTLDDRSCTLSPAEWGRRAVEAAIDWEADDVVVEVNYGGDMAVATITGAAEALGVNVPVRQVRATRGKRVRAEPVAALQERGQWHMVGLHERLEDQLCTWTPEADYSPDRLDGMVWPAWHMKLVSNFLLGTASYGGRQMAGTPIG